MQIVEFEQKRFFVTEKQSLELASLAGEKGYKVKNYTCGETEQSIMAFVPHNKDESKDGTFR